jgi:hypothetical protein
MLNAYILHCIATQPPYDLYFHCAKESIYELFCFDRGKYEIERAGQEIYILSFSTISTFTVSYCCKGKPLSTSTCEAKKF